MFVDGSAGLAALGLSSSDIPESLGRFCMYQWTGNGAPSTVGIGPFGLEEFSVDCPVSEPMGDANTPYVQDAQHELLRARVEAPHDDQPLGTMPVFVGLVDGTPGVPMSTPLMDHGKALEDIILDVACSSLGCGIQVVPTLAFPLDDTGALRDPDGGLYGTRGHVALGIMEAVARWKEEVSTGNPNTRLVINLSLGWVAPGAGALCGTTEAEPWCAAEGHVGAFDAFLAGAPRVFPTRNAIEAVHAALLYATCNGAVVVAAAGNTKADSCNTEPVAPAAWAKFHAPMPGECHALGFADSGSPWLMSDTGTRPLLHPVSGVEADGEPIAFTRPGSETQLVAAGSEATAGLETALTGTSVSAALVSSAFALLWSQEPSIPPALVAKRILDGARPLSRLPELDEFGASAGTPILDLSLCGALEEQARVAGSPPPAACLGLPPFEVALQGMDDALDDLYANFTPAYEADASLVAMETDECLACGDTVDVWLPDLEADAPHYFFNTCYESPASWIPEEDPNLAGPQPDVPICPNCPLIATSSQYVVLVSIDDEYRKGVSLDGGSLVIHEGTGYKKSFDLGTVLGDLSKLQTETRVKISVPSSGLLPRKALLEVKVTEDDTGKSYARSSALKISAK